MKKASMALVLIFVIAPLFISANNTENFETKAVDSAKAIAKKQAEYVSLKARYDEAVKKIDAIKSAKEENPFRAFINSIILNYYLKKGNNLGFKTYTLSKELSELKDDYFTYSMLVIEDNAKQLKECLKIKCGELAAIYEKRKKWIRESGSFSELLDLDLNVEAIAGALSGDAAKDMENYINKKIVQVDERMYMLKEEKDMTELVKKAGLNVSSSEVNILNFEIQQMMDGRKKLKEMLKK